MTRAHLDRAVLEWIAEGALAPPDDERFERLALQLFAYQHAENEAYRRYCTALGVDPESVTTWEAIPAIPTGAFKEARLATFPADRTVRTFRTSGSSTEKRGVLELDSLDLYEASLLATFSAFIRPEPDRVRFAVLAPSGTDAPDSSLSHMFDVAVRALGTERSAWYVEAEGWSPDRLIDDLRSGEPIVIVGTAFAFVHLLDVLGERGLRLEAPDGSRVLETGGFKGRSRELTREELHGAIVRTLGVPKDRIVNQYGMCELATQFYEDSIRTGCYSATKRSPPWARTRAVDPATLRNVPKGETGILVHYDLANTGSVIAVQTSDLGRLVDGGFEVLGRAPGAEVRGCSVAADLLLGPA